VQVLLKGRKRLTRIGLTCEGSGTSLLQRFEFFVTLLAPRLVDGAVRLRSAGLSVDEDPTWLNAAVGRGHLTIAIAGCERCQGLRISLGQDALSGVHGCRNPRDPLDVRLRELLEISFTREGAIRH
jgi:hypothetical protein